MTSRRSDVSEGRGAKDEEIRHAMFVHKRRQELASNFAQKKREGALVQGQAYKACGRSHAAGF